MYYYAISHYTVVDCKLTYSSHLILLCDVLLQSLGMQVGQFQFIWCSGGSIVAITPPDLSYSCFFPTRFATFVVSSSFCLSAETNETCEDGDLAETSHYWRRLTPHCTNGSANSNQTVYFREASTIDVYTSQSLQAGKSRLNFYPRDALLARSLLRQHVCPSVTAGTVSKRIKISSSFFLSLVAPPHRISNSTHDCELESKWPLTRRHSPMKVVHLIRN